MSYRFIEGSFRRTIVVGDIHGCLTEFNSILQRAAFDERDLLISVGDFLDRGPSSWEVARFFRDNANAHSVLGNHERRVAGTIRGTSMPAWTQRLTIAQIPPAERAGWAEFLASLPAVIETEHVIVTHGRLDPNLALQDQEPYYTAAVGGPTVVIPLDQEGVPEWYRSMKLAKPVCIGHVKYAQVELVTGALYALDTGAVQGGSLSAIVFPGAELIQVPAMRDYFAELDTRTILSGDVRSQRLDRLREFLEHPDEFHADFAKEEAARVVASLPGAALQSEMRQSLIALFGALPEPAPARGEYAMRLKTVFPDRFFSSLSYTLLAGKYLDVDYLARAFPAMRAGVAMDRIAELRTAIEEARRTRTTLLT